MTIQVRRPGLLSTLQDLGRYGYQKYGVMAGGAMDGFAHRAANRLVGNDDAEATLEMTVTGPVLYFEEPALISLCGSDLSPRIDGIPIPSWRPIYVRAGGTLQFGSAREGCRCYLAVSGGFNVPPRMNSCSTYLRAGLGGFEGRALQADDRLLLKPATSLGKRMMRRLSEQSPEAPFSAPAWRVSYEMVPDYKANPEIRVMPGGQYHWLEEAGRKAFFESEFKVLPQSDRMGYRLSGTPLYMAKPQELLSEPVAFGTVQVPPDGHPIVLMADRQTTGGYPKVAQVMTADLPLLAQASIGSRIRFRLVDLKEAQAALLRTEWNLDLLQLSIQMFFQ
ncbi:biotin-dependent carboxyltransferase family protein [Paenibacillus aurantius]|uniref:Biotin-dependent carboxyltransferase family protein n=1 Tax=Paenibacillus aurantius TaxID=2918900 RepID=A0AA96LH78_9BACL|nr:biotin-dependent carboxyltransferase family protein [Paenibacillus aurantius]WNQ14064.1 biotin-dependent carboxyltransferase family protein [Paenibacillus aurantius]